MPKVSDAHRASRRDQIVAAARRCFARQGFSSTTMADIIEEAGLSAGAIYGYFPSKQQLAAAVARATFASRLVEAREAARVKPLSPGDTLRLVRDGIARDGISPGLVVQLWAEAQSSEEIRGVARDGVLNIRNVLGEHLTEWAVQVRGMTRDDATEWVMGKLPVLLGIGQGMLLQQALVDSFDFEGYLAAVDALFLAA